MKIILKLGSFVLVICIIVLGLHLPDSIFGYMDRNNKNVKTNELPAVKLEFSYGMSLDTKLDLTTSGYPTTVVSQDVVESDRDSIVDAVNDIVGRISAHTHHNYEPTLYIDEMLPVMFAAPMSDTSAVFWVVRGNYGLDRYAFIIDDETKNLLSIFIEYNGLVINSYIGDIMWKTAECVREIVYDQFSKGDWYPYEDSFLYSDVYDDSGKKYTEFEKYIYNIPNNKNGFMEVPLVYNPISIAFGRDLGSIIYGSIIADLKF